MIRICTEEVLKAIRAQPKAAVFSLSINDSYDYCECPVCQKLAKEEDSQMGPVLQLVNHVAEAVEKEFPDKAVETLAYLSVRHPPKHLRPRPNVIIRLAPIGCCMSHPMATCDCKMNREARCRPGSLVENHVADLDLGLYHRLRPFPRAVPEPTAYSRRISGIMSPTTSRASSWRTPTTHRTANIAALGGYMMAKLLWNPNYDPNLARDEFLAGYYGKAAIPIRQYLDLLNGRGGTISKYHFYGRDSLDTTSPAGMAWELPSPYLTYEFLIQANELWQQGRILWPTIRKCSDG